MLRQIGFIGTGLMGCGMARNLIRKGHSVRIYNRTRSRAEEVAQIGGTVVSSPAEAARGAEVVFTMLADPAAVLQVLEGENGVLSAISPGAILIDSSTVSPAVTVQVRDQLRSRGAEMLDAPVFGSKAEAEKGELGFIIGGEKAVLDKVQDVLACLGKINHVGGNGMGSYAKLVVNLIIASTLEAFNEGMVLAAKAGLDPDLMSKIILSSRARSGIIEMKAPNILSGNFTPFFPLKLMGKDIGLALDTARALDVPAPLVTALAEVYKASVAQGLGEQDFAATVKLLEEKSGVQVRSRSNTSQ